MSQDSQNSLNLRRKVQDTLATLAVLLMIQMVSLMGLQHPVTIRDYQIVVDNCFDRDKRKIIHNWAASFGLISITDNTRRLAIDRYGCVKCKKCPFTSNTYVHTYGSVVPYYSWGPDYVYADDTNKYCSSYHTYPYISRLGRIIIWHPSVQPKLTKQALKQLAWRQRTQRIMAALWSLAQLNVIRDVRYIIVNFAFGVKVRRVQVCK
jgi:hypothetical protein